MNNKGVKLSAVLITSLVCTFVASMAMAAIVELDAIDSGWYSNNGAHSSMNNNYGVGEGSGLVHRNFFVFDLSGITLPIGTATLSVYNPFGGFESSDPSETWNLWMVSNSIADLTDDHLVADPAGIEIYEDLGGTISFGSRTVSATDNDTMVNVPLNADALSDLNYWRGSQWAVGGSLTTLDAVFNTEAVFMWTVGSETKRLILTTCEYGNGQVCYSLCPTGSCPPSHCTINVPGIMGCINVGQITYCGCTLGSCAPSQCVVYIPVP